MNSTPVDAPTIRTVLSDTGIPQVLFQLGTPKEPIRMVFDPDSAVQLALNMLSAAYAARAEAALFQEAKSMGITPINALRAMRGGVIKGDQV